MKAAFAIVALSLVMTATPSVHQNGAPGGSWFDKIVNIIWSPNPWAVNY